MLNELLFLAAGEDAMRHLNDSVRPGSVLHALFMSAVAVGLAAAPSPPGWATEASWIWTPQHAKGKVPEVACYFRKTFTAQAPIRVQATIAADDEYELFVNGTKVGTGNSFRTLDEYNVTEHIKTGRNTIAVKVTNRHGSTAALARAYSCESGVADGSLIPAMKHGAPASIRWRSGTDRCTTIAPGNQPKTSENSERPPPGTTTRK